MESLAELERPRPMVFPSRSLATGSPVCCRCLNLIGASSTTAKRKEVMAMGWWGRLWDLAYVWRTPWDIGGPRPELMRLVESGELDPGKAIDLGCGAGDNVIYLAQQRFEATGVDISPRAIAKARRKAEAAGVSPTFIVGDVANLTGVEGPFDLLVDNGCFHSLFGSAARQGYERTVMRLSRPGTRFFLRRFVREQRRSRLGLPESFHAGEVERCFGRAFDIEELEPLPPGRGAPLMSVDEVYLMTRN